MLGRTVISAKRSLPPTTPSGPAVKLLKSIPTGPRAQSGLSISHSQHRPGPSLPPGPSIPTGPRALTSRGIPTGPRSLTLSASYSTQAQSAETPTPDDFPEFRKQKQRAKSISRSRSATSQDRERDDDLFREGSIAGSVSNKPEDYENENDLGSDQDDGMTGTRGRQANGRGRGRGRGRSGGSSTTKQSANGLKQVQGPLRDKDQIMAEFGVGVVLKPAWDDSPKGSAELAGMKFTAVEGVLDGIRLFRLV